MPPTESPELVCRCRHFPQCLRQGVRPVPVCVDQRADDALKETPTGVGSTEDLDRRDGTW